MFWGTHRVRVDEKGRLAIPAAFRRQLPDSSFISIGQDGVLTIYPPDQWESLASGLQDPLLGPEQRIAPGNCIAHGLLSSRHVARSARQEWQALLEVVEQ